MTSPSDQTGNSSLSRMKIAELQSVASQLGMSGFSKLRKSELVEAIGAQRAAIREAAAQSKAATEVSPEVREVSSESKDRKSVGPSSDESEQTSLDIPATQGSKGVTTGDVKDSQGGGQQPRSNQRKPRRSGRAAGEATKSAEQGRAENQRRDNRRQNSQDSAASSGSDDKIASLDEIIRLPGGKEEPSGDKDSNRGEPKANNRNSDGRRHQNDRTQRAVEAALDAAQAAKGGDDDEDAQGRRRGRNRDRNRDRDRKRRGTKDENAFDEGDLLEDDVLIPVAGVLDVLDNYAFVRTTGYLPGTNDVYVSLGQVKKANLRPGDAVTGAVRQPREGEVQRQKFNALVRLELVNGVPFSEAEDRQEFATLSPVHPHERLQVENGKAEPALRVLDIVAPLAKGQRVLVQAPSHAGRTALIRQLTDSIATHHEEIHLMVVVVDERPEDVTELRRNVRGEVIATTFDQAPTEHVSIAELALERARRLVELGQDVVLVVDSMTSLAQAYQATTPQGSRTSTSAVEAQALLGPKKYFGAARKIEHGGSLTIVATAVTGVPGNSDAVIQELGRTANAEIVLLDQGGHADIFPAIDPGRSRAFGQEHYIADAALVSRRQWQGTARAADPIKALAAVGRILKSTVTNQDALAKPLKVAGSTGE